jgi:hypothetical protein
MKYRTRTYYTHNQKAKNHNSRRSAYRGSGFVHQGGADRRSKWRSATGFSSSSLSAAELEW